MMRAYLAAALIVVGVPLVTFWTILFGHDTLYPADLLHEAFLPFAEGRSGTNIQVTAITDYVTTFYPSRVFIWESLRSWHLPLWNPFILGGHPHFANWGSIPTFDPFNVLYWLPSLPTALAWRTALQDIACAAFMALYLLHLRLRPMAAAFGGLAFALNSMFYANIFDYSLSGILWLPLILLVVERGLASSGWIQAFPAGLVLGIGLLSCPLQFYLFTLIALASVVSVKWWIEHRPTMPWPRFACYLGSVCVFGILLSAVQLLPALELIGVSVRRLTDSGQGFRSPLEMLTGTLALMTFVFPNLGGNLKGGMLLAQAWGGTTHFQGYIGVISFVCAVVAAWSLPRRHTAPYLALGLGAVAVVLYTPLAMFLYERFFVLYIFSAAVLAGMGFDHLAANDWNQDRIRAVLKVFFWFFIAVLAGVLIWTVAFLGWREAILTKADAYLLSIIPGRYLGNNIPLHMQKLRNTLEGLTLLSPAMWLPLSAAFAAVALFNLRLRKRISSPAFQVVCVTVLAAELVFMVWTHVPFVDQREYPLFPPTPSIELIKQDPDLFRVFSLRRYSKEPPLLSVSMPAVYGLQTVEGKENLYPPNLWSILPRELQSATDRVPEQFALLDLENVKYVLTGPLTDLPSDRFELVHQDAVRVYRNRAVLPRAFLVSDYRVVADTREALEAIRRPDFNPRKTVILDADPPIRPAAEESTADVVVARYQPTEVEIRASTFMPQLLVLSDVFYPGWLVTIDGEPAQLLRANVAMRAVALPPGDHVVRYVFAPTSVLAGLAISVATLLVLVCGLLASLFFCRATRAA